MSSASNHSGVLGRPLGPSTPSRTAPSSSPASRLLRSPRKRKAVIITGRSDAKLKETQDFVSVTYPSVTFKPSTFDLSAQKYVHEAANDVSACSDVHAIDMVLNNAGVMNIQERRLSIYGVEIHLATNHLGHFLFTNLVMAKILAGTTQRIINASSMATSVSPIHASDLNWKKPLRETPDNEKPNVEMLKTATFSVDNGTAYISMAAYGARNTANAVYSVGLNPRRGDNGILSLASHRRDQDAAAADHGSGVASEDRGVCEEERTAGL